VPAERRHIDGKLSKRRLGERLLVLGLRMRCDLLGWASLVRASSTPSVWAGLHAGTDFNVSSFIYQGNYDVTPATPIWPSWSVATTQGGHPVQDRLQLPHRL
jgi:hypothetical protein